MTSTTRWPEYIGYHDVPGDPVTPALDSDTLAASNAKLAKLGLAEIMEHVVVDGRNATLFKGPQAAEYHAVHEDSQRRCAEFQQSDVYMQMQAEAAACEAKLKAGLYTAEELEQIEAPARWLREHPRICDLFTAEELDEYPHDFTFMIPEEWRIKKNPQSEADRDKLRKLFEEAVDVLLGVVVDRVSESIWRIKLRRW
jgi:hypothetical protein